MNNVTGNKRSRLWWSVAFIVIVAATVWTITAQYQSFSIRSFSKFIREAQFGWLLAAIAAALGFVVFEALALSTACKPFGYRVGLKNSLVYSSADIYFSAITPSATGGQPACAYFMVKNGISGTAATAILLANLIMYTLAIVSLGVIGFLLFPSVFFSFNTLSKALILFGYAAQLVLVVVFSMILLKRKIFERLCAGGIRFLCRLKILHHQEQRLQKLAQQMLEYEQSVTVLRNRKVMLVKMFLFNFLQRFSTVMVTVFVYLATGGSIANACLLFAVQIYAVIGSNCVPIPGAVGVSDYLMLNGFTAFMSTESAVYLELLSRSLSCYFCVIICGILVLCSYIAQSRRKNNVRCV